MTDTDLLNLAGERPLVPTVAAARGVDTSSIVGWGVDADPRNDPTYPYRVRAKDDHSGEWARPPQQRREVEILQSIEHKRLPAVFGSASPPKWLSGAIRRLAFRWSESNWTHWLLLMGADRVNMVEGLVEDVARGKIPNIPKEMGVPAEWKHNKVGLVKKVAVAAAIGGALIALSRSRRDEDE
jgi:hypothetical protein